MNRRDLSGSSTSSLGLFIANALVPVAFSQLGTIGGFPYLFAVLHGDFSSATFFRTVKVRRVTYVPARTDRPIPRSLVGVAGFLAVRPLLGDAKNAALAEDFVGAVIILGVFALMALWFRRLQSGSLY